VRGCSDEGDGPIVEFAGVESCEIAVYDGAVRDERARIVDGMIDLGGGHDSEDKKEGKRKKKPH
jgi:hypothetical protein